jgi:hypothetical protein
MDRRARRIESQAFRQAEPVEPNCGDASSTVIAYGNRKVWPFRLLRLRLNCVQSRVFVKVCGARSLGMRARASRPSRAAGKCLLDEPGPRRSVHSS